MNPNPPKEDDDATPENDTDVDVSDSTDHQANPEHTTFEKKPDTSDSPKVQRPRQTF